MKRYYKANKEKWDASRKKRRDEINAAKRKRYAEDQKTRDYYIAQAKEYRRKNPEAKRRYEIKRLYGISKEDYQLLLADQHGKCGICKLEFTKTPHVDHCRASGVVRGLLCFNCNRAIGHFQDSVEIIQNAINYLSKDKE